LQHLPHQGPLQACHLLLLLLLLLSLSPAAVLRWQGVT
jgi:hypothetical protein